jgi:hypothetical protein
MRKTKLNKSNKKIKINKLMVILSLKISMISSQPLALSTLQNQSTLVVEYYHLIKNYMQVVTIKYQSIV